MRMFIRIAGDGDYPVDNTTQIRKAQHALWKAGIRSARVWLVGDDEPRGMELPARKDSDGGKP